MTIKRAATILNQQDVQTPRGPMQSSQQPSLQAEQVAVAGTSGCFLQSVCVIISELERKAKKLTKSFFDEFDLSLFCQQNPAGENIQNGQQPFTCMQKRGKRA